MCPLLIICNMKSKRNKTKKVFFENSMHCTRLTYSASCVPGLNLKDYSSDGEQKVTYDLYAVSNHSGGVHSGHYTAICKHPYSGEWNTFNDTRWVTLHALILASDIFTHSDASMWHLHAMWLYTCTGSWKRQPMMVLNCFHILLPASWYGFFFFFFFGWGG